MFLSNTQALFLNSNAMLRICPIRSDTSAFMWHRIRPTIPRQIETEAFSWCPGDSKTQSGEPGPPLSLSSRFIDSILGNMNRDHPGFSATSILLASGVCENKINAHRLLSTGRVFLNGQLWTPNKDALAGIDPRDLSFFSIDGLSLEYLATTKIVLQKAARVFCGLDPLGGTDLRDQMKTGLISCASGLDFLSSGVVIFSNDLEFRFWINSKARHEWNVQPIRATKDWSKKINIEEISRFLGAAEVSVDEDRIRVVTVGRSVEDLRRVFGNARIRRLSIEGVE